ncbi:enoyl-CoA hydratase [Mycolicibacterium sp. (ex Dasyatis americana)]|nr:enoyl-CoA hydratase [Mycolicibacterium sp. (ex Dasyatis americana)]
MNRPHRLNSMTAGMIERLHTVLAEIEHDRSTRVVVLTGAGRGFCAGLDLEGYGTVDTTTQGRAHRVLATQRHIASLMQRIRRLPQPVIAMVNGPAAGGGLGLVCAADIRIAAETAVFAASFIRVGFSGCDMGVSWMLPRLVGAGRAHELMLTGRKFTASNAVSMGLIAEAVPARNLGTRVDELIDSLLAAPPLSLSLTKQGMWLGLEAHSFDAAVELENRQQVITALTRDQEEAMLSFREERNPEYHNE